MKEGFVKSQDNTQIYYHMEGDRSATQDIPLIFCYGIVCSIYQWKYQLSHFSKNHLVVYFDYRGHNRSQTPKDPSHLTFKGCAEDLYAVMKKLHIKKAVLLGHSMGVNVIFQFAATYPERTAGLVAICGTLSNPFKTMFNTDFSLAGFEFLKIAYLKFPKQFPKIWKKTIPSPMSRLITGLLGFTPKFTKRRDVKIYLDGVAKQPPSTFLHFLQEMAHFDGDEILSKIKAPALIIGGAKDFIIPIQNQYAIYRKMKKQAQFLRVPQGSHCSHMDMPELVNLRIEKFLNQIKNL